MGLQLQDMSFREKSAWISLISTAVVLGPYFARVWVMFSAGTLEAWAVWTSFAGAVVSQVILEVIAHALLVRHDERLPRDERDAAIESRAFRFAYTVLSVGVFVMIGVASLDTARLSLSLLAVGQAVLLCFVAAETVRYGVQVSGYRFGLGAG